LDIRLWKANFWLIRLKDEKRMGMKPVYPIFDEACIIIGEG
jgi:hypothetical protein